MMAVLIGESIDDLSGIRIQSCDMMWVMRSMRTYAGPGQMAVYIMTRWGARGCVAVPTCSQHVSS